MAIAAVVVAAAWRDRRWVRVLIHGGGAAVASVALLFVISPVLFTDAASVRHQLHRQALGDRLGNPDRGELGNMAGYVSGFVHSSGLILAGLVVVGVVAAVVHRRVAVLTWLVGLVYWVALSSLPLAWPRWGLPMWITPLLFAALGADFLLARWRASPARHVAVTAMVIALVVTTAGSVDVLSGLLGRDARQDAVAFTDRHHITRENAAYDGYSPLRRRGPKYLSRQARAEGDGFSFRTKEGEPARYAVLSSYMYRRVLADPARTQDQRVYRWVFAHAREIHRVTPLPATTPSSLDPVIVWRAATHAARVASGARVGPEIRIFRLVPAR